MCQETTQTATMCQETPISSNMPQVAPGQRAFPYKLYALLEEAEVNGFAHIISWQPGGTSFRVHQPKLFTESILPQCFKQTKYKSFLRQLNIYDFQRIQHGPNKNGYAHVHLVKGKPELCHAIVRVFVPTKRKRGKQRSTIDNTKTAMPDIILADEPVSELKAISESFSVRNAELGPEAAAPTPIAQTSQMMGVGDGVFTLMSPPEPAAIGSGSSSRTPSATMPAKALGGSSEFFAGKQFSSTDGGSRLGSSTGCSISLCGSRSDLSATLRGTGGSTSSLQCSASEVEDFFKDLFKPSALEQDVPFLHQNSYCQLFAGKGLGAGQNSAGAKNAQFDLSKAQGGKTMPYLPSRVSSSSSSERMHLSSELEGLDQTESDTSSDTTQQSSISTKKSLTPWSGLYPTQEEMFDLANDRSGSLGSMTSTDRPRSTSSSNNEDLTRSESVFPAKLHRMLQDSKREGFEHIVSWIQGGTAFKVHDVQAFMEHIMMKYFDQSKYQSFRRQLNLYHFTRVNSAVHGTYYFHKSFLQNDPSLVHQIVRPKTSRRSRTH